METTKPHTLLSFTGYIHHPVKYTRTYQIQENGLNRSLIGETPSTLENTYGITPLRIGPRTRCRHNSAHQKIIHGTKIEICAGEETLRDFEEAVGLASEEDLNFEPEDTY